MHVPLEFVDICSRTSMHFLTSSYLKCGRIPTHQNPCFELLKIRFSMNLPRSTRQMSCDLENSKGRFLVAHRTWITWRSARQQPAQHLPIRPDCAKSAQNDCDKSQFTENITWIRHSQLLNLCRTVGATKKLSARDKTCPYAHFIERCIIGVLCISISNSFAAHPQPGRPGPRFPPPPPGFFQWVLLSLFPPVEASHKLGNFRFSPRGG